MKNDHWWDDGCAFVEVGLNDVIDWDDGDVFQHVDFLCMQAKADAMGLGINAKQRLPEIKKKGKRVGSRVKS